MENFVDAPPEDVLRNKKRARILRKIDVKFDPTIDPLPSWDDTKFIKYAAPGNTDATENMPDYPNMTALRFAYEKIASTNRPAQSQYYIFRMMTGTGKSTIIPIAWMLSGAKGPVLMTQPRRGNVLSISTVLATYAGDLYEFPKKYVDPDVKKESEKPDFPQYTPETGSVEMINIIVAILKRLGENSIATKLDKYFTVTTLGLERAERKKLSLICSSLNALSPNPIFQEIIDQVKTSFTTVDFKLGASDNNPSQHEPAKKPKILVVTEGWLVEKLIRKKDYLKKFHTIIFDEAHERTVEFDLLLSYVNMQKTPFHIVLASATITESQFMHLSPHRIFLGAQSKEIDTTLNFVSRAPYMIMLTDAITKLISTRTESIIAFLPTVSNVEIMMKKFSEKYKEIKFFDFTAKSAPESQDGAKKYVASRKIVFATNAAETGITFDEIDICVDSGMQNVVSYDPVFDSSSAKIDLVYSENMKQRRGRVGRIRKGYFFPLYDPTTLKQSPPPKILDQNSYSSIYRMMRLSNSTDFRPFNNSLLTPISEIAIYHGLSNLYHMHVIDKLPENATDKIKKIGYKLGSMYGKSIMGNIRYLVAAGLSRRTAPLFIILYAASKLNVISSKVAYTYLPLQSDHLQLIMFFYEYMFSGWRTGENNSQTQTYQKIADEAARILGTEKLPYDKNLEPAEYVMEKNRGLYPLRLLMENCFRDQMAENFETFRRCMFLSHEDKIAVHSSGNIYKWRGLKIRIASPHYTSEIRVPPLFLSPSKRVRNYFVAAPPRVAFTEISKNAGDDYASINTFTAV